MRSDNIARKVAEVANYPVTIEESNSELADYIKSYTLLIEGMSKFSNVEE